MRSLNLLLFLTLVLGPLATFGAPHDEAPEPVEEEAQVEGADPELLQNTVMTDVPTRKSRMSEFVERFNRRDYYHSYRQALYPHIGALMALQNSTDDDPDKDSELLNYMLGFFWEMPRKLSPKYEVGLTWSTMGIGQLNLARKHIFNEKGAFRPFYKYGLTMKIDPDEELATSSNFENYLITAGVGLENIMKPPRSVRLDLEAAIGAEDMWIMFRYGYSWGW